MEKVKDLKAVEVEPVQEFYVVFTQYYDSKQLYGSNPYRTLIEAQSHSSRIGAKSKIYRVVVDARDFDAS